MKGGRLAGDVDSSIVNPAKLSPSLALNICMYCHEQGDARVLNPGKNFADFRPGTPLANTLTIFISLNHPPEEKQTFLGYYSEMKASKCYYMSQGQLTCLTCHNPHRQLAGSELVTITERNVSLATPTKVASCPCKPGFRRKRQIVA